MPGPVFVSYSRHDQPYAMKLVEHLQEAGFEVWVDTEIHYGTRWENEVRRQIETAAAMVVVMTPNAEQSEHVANELGWARKRKTPILPVLLSGESFFALSRTHYFDARDGSLPGRPFLADLAQEVNRPAPADAPTPVAELPLRGAHVPAPGASTGPRRWWLIGVSTATAVLIAGSVAAFTMNDREEPGGVSPSPAYTGALLREGYLGQLTSTDQTLCVEALSGLRNPGASVGRAACADGDKQELITLRTGGAATDWKLRFKHGDDVCLGVTDDSRAEDRRPALAACASAPAWRFEDWGEKADDRYWHIRYTGSGGAYCLARPVPAAEGDTRLQLAKCDRNDGYGQQWRAERQ